jgi:hypothetical protein
MVRLSVNGCCCCCCCWWWWRGLLETELACPLVGVVDRRLLPTLIWLSDPSWWPSRALLPLLQSSMLALLLPVSRSSCSTLLLGRFKDCCHLGEAGAEAAEAAAAAYTSVPSSSWNWLSAGCSGDRRWW